MIPIIFTVLCMGVGLATMEPMWAVAAALFLMNLTMSFDGSDGDDEE